MSISIVLEPETERRLDAMSKATGTPIADHVRKFVEDGLEDYEDYQAAIEVSERIRRGKEETVPWTEVRRELGLDG